MHETDGVRVGDTPPATRNDDVMTWWNPIFIVSSLNCRRDTLSGCYQFLKEKNFPFYFSNNKILREKKRSNCNATVSSSRWLSQKLMRVYSVICNVIYLKEIITVMRKIIKHITFWNFYKIHDRTTLVIIRDKYAIALFYYFILFPLWLYVLDFFQRLRNLFPETLFVRHSLIIKRPRATAVNRSSRASRD